MPSICAIAGTPRSGSTLLCNIVNQNPCCHVSSTSCIPKLIRAVSETCEKKSQEYISELHHDRDGTEARFLNVLRGIPMSWYEQELDAGKIVFDKSREWQNRALLLKRMYPDARLILLKECETF